MTEQSEISPYIKPMEARDFGIGARAWYRLIHSGQIPAIRIGRKLAVPRAAFLNWFNSAGGQIVTQAKATLGQ